MSLSHMTFEQIMFLRDHGIQSTSVLAIILLVEDEMLMDEICKQSGMSRRGLERILKNNDDFLEKVSVYYPNPKVIGPPYTMAIVRTPYAEKILREAESL